MPTFYFLRLTSEGAVAFLLLSAQNLPLPAFLSNANLTKLVFQSFFVMQS